ncbi:MAG: hypothetical protein ACI9UQ_001183, partial [Candidatus Krumholzibacteriia bacterium]
YLPCTSQDQHGVAACDYDGNGTWDMYVTVGADRGEGEGPNQMWSRNSEGLFENAIPPTHFMADHMGRGRGALWLRIDDDTFPELLVLNYKTPARLYRFDGQAWADYSGVVNPFHTPNPRRVERNNGSSFGVATAGDLDNDGRTDLMLAGAGFFIFQNGEPGNLLDVTEAAGFPVRAPGLADLALGDLDNDGDLDALFCFRYVGGIEVYLNESTAGNIRFVEGPSLENLPLAPERDSVLLADFDNDGVLDLLVMMQDQEKKNRSDLLARGVGDGSFTDVSSTWGADEVVEALPRGSWAMDVDHDGDLDLLKVHGKGEFPERAGLCSMYENRAHNNGVTVELLIPGGVPHGMGARVTLHSALGAQMREVRSVIHHGNSTIAPVHFGVGLANGPYRVVIIWPGGDKQVVILPEAGRAYQVTKSIVLASVWQGGQGWTP